MAESLLRRVIRRELLALQEAGDRDPEAQAVRLRDATVRNIVKLVTELDPKTRKALEAFDLFKTFNSWNSNGDIFNNSKTRNIVNILASLQEFDPIMRLLVDNFLGQVSAAKLEAEIVAWLEEMDFQSAHDLAKLQNYESDIKKLFDTVRKAVEEVESASEAPPGSPLGRIAFANARPDMPPESDTEVESRLLRRIWNHFSGNQLLEPREMEMIRGFMRDGIYTSIFRESNEHQLVRGISISEKFLRELTGIEGEIPEKGSIETSYTYTTRTASSWTSEQWVAKNFARRGTSPAYDNTPGVPFAVLLHARVGDNPNTFVAGPGGLYGIKAVSTAYGNEEETIALGPVRLFAVEWQNMYPPDNASYHAALRALNIEP